MRIFDGTLSSPPLFYSACVPLSLFSLPPCLAKDLPLLPGYLCIFSSRRVLLVLLPSTFHVSTRVKRGRTGNFSCCALHFFSSVTSVAPLPGVSMSFACFFAKTSDVSRRRSSPPSRKCLRGVSLVPRDARTFHTEAEGMCSPWHRVCTPIVQRHRKEAQKKGASTERHGRGRRGGEGGGRGGGWLRFPRNATKRQFFFFSGYCRCRCRSGVRNHSTIAQEWRVRYISEERCIRDTWHFAWLFFQWSRV